jgi:hypothetical protein
VHPNTDSLSKVYSLWLSDFTTTNLDHILYNQENNPRYLEGSVSNNTEVLKAILDEISPQLENCLIKPIVKNLQQLGYQQAILLC